MSTSATPARDGEVKPEIMASMDGTGPSPRLVIADITVEDAWVSINADSAASLASWR